MFGFRRKQEKLELSIAAKPANSREELIRDSVKFIVENDYQVTNGRLYPLIPQVAKEGKYAARKKSIETGVQRTLEEFSTRPDKFILDRVEELKQILFRQQLTAEISSEIHSDILDTVRGRALVKAFQAGLDKSEIYLKLMESQDLKELEYMERWVERSNAYQASQAS